MEFDGHIEAKARAVDSPEKWALTGDGDLALFSLDAAAEIKTFVDGLMSSSNATKEMYGILKFSNKFKKGSF